MFRAAVETFETGHGHVDGEAFRAQPGHESLGEVILVLHHQDPHRFHDRLSGPSRGRVTLASGQTW